MKKILAILLALVLTLALGAVAFATEKDPVTSTYTDATSITVTKVYKLIGEGSSPAETFTLAQVGDGVVKDGEATSAPALGTITGAVFAEGDANAEGEEGTITIELPEYSSVGVYEYTLKEVAGTTAGVAYYGDDIKLVVTVINGGNGKLRVAAVHTEAAGGQKSDTFENTYSAGTLSIKKIVAGNLGDKEKYFNVTVTLTGETDKTYGASYAVTGGSKEGNPAVIAIGTPTTFALKHNETITIANLPYGVTYTVEEANYTAPKDGGYEAAVYVFSDTDKKIDTAADTIEITNTKGGTVDTGITTDSLPYVILLGIVILIGAGMIIKRRAFHK